MDAAAIARALGGEVAGRARVLAPGPGHSKGDRSLSVRLDPAAPDGFRVHSFADDPWQACRDHVRQRLGLGEWKPGEKPQRLNVLTSSPAAAAPTNTADDMVADFVLGRTLRLPSLPWRRVAAAEPADATMLQRQKQAGSIWRAAVSIVGTPAEAYLASRGLRYEREALRWHPACPFGPERLGCMVALVRDIVTDERQAIHRTALAPDATKIGRLSLGPISGGAVKLADNADVTLALGLGEGIETTLSLAHLVGLPVWATVTAGNLAAFPVLPGLESLWLAVDNDASGTGARAAQACVERHEQAGVETITATPDALGADLNDRVRRHAG